MSGVLVVGLNATPTRSTWPVPDARSSSASPVPAGVSLRHSSTIPRSQAYYWKRIWREAEQEALAERELGLAVRFTNPKDAIRWLLTSGSE